jgi:hypothetical protein
MAGLGCQNGVFKVIKNVSACNVPVLKKNTNKKI